MTTTLIEEQGSGHSFYVYLGCLRFESRLVQHNSICVWCFSVLLLSHPG